MDTQRGIVGLHGVWLDLPSGLITDGLLISEDAICTSSDSLRFRFNPRLVVEGMSDLRQGRLKQAGESWTKFLSYQMVLPIVKS
jgi:hypothetical protein